MTAINNASAAVTALYKFYQTNDTKFYSATSTAGQFPDEIFAATLNATTTTNQTILRFIESSGGTWHKYEMLDAITSAVISITGVKKGDFVRLGNKVLYSNYEDNVKLIKTRTSSGDTDNNYIFNAGLPDPNAYKVIDRMDETSGWSDGGEGDYGFGLDKSPLHRLEGNACIVLYQNTANKSAKISKTFSSALDLTEFDDGTTSNNNDYIALNVFRFEKRHIATVSIRLYSSGGNYFHYNITETPTETDLSGNAWDNWHYHQTTTIAEWNLNPYDNQMFRIRARKGWFSQTGNPDWSNINIIELTVKSHDNASSTRQAKVCFDDIKLLKTPPIAKNFKIQLATFEESESGSSTGWEKTESSTSSDFNRVITREGYSSLVVTRAAAADGTATATLRFDSPKNLAVYPDGTTASNGDVMKINVWWKGIDLSNSITWTADYSNFIPPKIRFTDSGGNFSQVTVWCLSSLLGGGDTKQVIFNTTGGGLWSSSATPADFTSISKISIWGPFYNGVSCEAYVMDDLRIERPNAIQPVNIFEPMELIALDAFTAFADAHLKDFAWVATLISEGLKLLFSSLKYQTYGMGHAIYPDYEHSSIGIAGLTLTSWGSKTFGMLLSNPDAVLDLSVFKIAQVLWPPQWDPENGKYLIFQISEIPAGNNDRFCIWLASEDIKSVREVKIKFHPNDGTNQPSRVNYWEYSITGMELVAKMVEQAIEDKETADILNALSNARYNSGDIRTYHLGGSKNNDPGSVRQFFTSVVRNLGKDRGGWPSAVYEWKKKDMIFVAGDETSVDWSDIRGIGVEVTGAGGNATICVDNLMMLKEGSLKGEFYYKVVLEDEEGYLSPSSEPSLRVNVDKKDIVLDNIYVPSTKDQVRIKNKKIYRLGGTSTEWRYVGDLAVNKDEFFDNVFEEDLGRILPEDSYAPPQSKIIKQVGNSIYYANVIDRLGQKLPYRVYKSETFCPFRVSDFSCVDIPETKGSGITGIEEYYNYICIWTPDAMWTIDPDLKGIPQRRSFRGCVAKRSIAMSEYGLIWLSPIGLMLGNISGVNEKFFEPINSLFDEYTEEDLKNSIGFVIDRWYYLFYDITNGKGICCYLPDGSFSELSGPFDVNSIMICDGRDDNNVIYYGRSNGTIFKMFDGEEDNGTAITTELLSKDFTEPGIQYDKIGKAVYIAAANLGSNNATITPSIYVEQSSKDTLPTITVTSTSIKTFVSKASQGDYGTHTGIKLAGTNRHKISQIVYKQFVEEDVEYSP